MDLFKTIKDKVQGYLNPDSKSKKEETPRDTAQKQGTQAPAPLALPLQIGDFYLRSAKQKAQIIDTPFGKQMVAREEE